MIVATSNIIDGNAIAEAIIKDELCPRFIALGREINLALISAGDNGAALAYQRQVERYCKILGIGYQLYVFDQDVRRFTPQVQLFVS